MLFTLPPHDTGSASILLSETHWAGRASIHWTMPKEYLLSSHLSDPKYQILGTPSRSLTEVEERLVWKSLFDSAEALYTL
jgi:hypothetical protein